MNHYFHVSITHLYRRILFDMPKQQSVFILSLGLVYAYDQCYKNDNLIKTLENKIEKLEDRIESLKQPFNKQTSIYTTSHNLRIFADSKKSVIIKKSKQQQRLPNPPPKLKFSTVYFPINSCSTTTEFKYQTCQLNYQLEVLNPVHKKCDGIY